MLIDKTGRPKLVNRPLTHRDCLDAGRQKPTGCAGTGLPWVQLRRAHPDGSYQLCGQVIEIHEDRAEWFKVETEIGTYWTTGQNLRMCSGDGRCTCEPGRQQHPQEQGHAWSTDQPANDEFPQWCDLQRGCGVRPTRFP